MHHPRIATPDPVAVKWHIDSHIEIAHRIVSDVKTRDYMSGFSAWTCSLAHRGSHRCRPIGFGATPDLWVRVEMAEVARAVPRIVKKSLSPAP